MLPGGSDGKESSCNAKDLGSLFGQEDPLEKGLGPLQYSCLENSIDRETWWATVHGIRVRHDWAAKSYLKSIYYMLGTIQ